MSDSEKKTRHELSRDDRRKGAEKAAEAERRKRDERRQLGADARTDALDDAITELSEAAAKAARSITRLVDGTANEALQLRAARAVLEVLVDAEWLDIGVRLDRLEAERDHESRNGGWR